MPLTRYQLRNEYGLADPELYKAADKDDPEALLEGVAMAGLVGVLRQLGDLAEFAAEIFHDLHEEVMTTAARGHALMARVQQLEAEFPTIEKAFLFQTNHSPFFSSSGVDWHPNLQMEQNLITRGDLPRFVMDSYEECRGPPQLFLLDKFDVAGVGACLKRYTDPSFFKFETASSGIETVGVQRDKKHQKKKKGSRWRKGETTEVVPTSHAKLHELFLEERIDNGNSDPACLVRLKRRQLNGSLFDLKPGKSYMGKFVLTPSPEHKQVCEVSITLDNSSESGYEIHEVSVASSVKESSYQEESTYPSPKAQEPVLKPFMDESNDDAIHCEIIKALDPIVDHDMNSSPVTIHKMKIEEELTFDADEKTENTLDGDNSDDMISEVDNYLDALTTMDSEMETDNEYKPRNIQDLMNVREQAADLAANEEQLDFQENCPDTQSIGNSSVSEGGNSLIKEGRSSFAHPGSPSNLADNAPFDYGGAAKVFASTENYATDIINSPSDHLYTYVETGASEPHQLVAFNNTCTEEDKIPDHDEASSSLCLTHLNPVVPHADHLADSLVVPLAGREPDGASSGSTKLGCESPSSDRKGSNHADSLKVFSDMPSETGHVTSLSVSYTSVPVDEVEHGDSDMLADAVVHLSEISDLASEEKVSDDSENEVLETDYAAEHLVEGMVVSMHPASTPVDEQSPCLALPAVELDSSVASLSDCPDVAKSGSLVSKIDGPLSTSETSTENLKPEIDTSGADSIKENLISDIRIDTSQLEFDPTKFKISCSEKKVKLNGILEGPDAEEMNSLKVDADGGEAALFENQLSSSDNRKLEDHLILDDTVTETVQAEDIAALTASVSGANNDDIINGICTSSELVCLSSRNPTGMQDSLSISEMLDPEVISAECLPESQVQMEVKQLQVTSEVYLKPKVIEHIHNESSELSSQEMETKADHQRHFVEASDNTICLPACHLLESGSSLEQSIELQGDVLVDDTSTSLNCQTSSAGFLVGTDISLKHSLELQSDHLDRGCLQLGETSSRSTDLPFEQGHDLHHITEDRCHESSSLKDLPISKLLLPSVCPEHNSIDPMTSSLDSVFHRFGKLPEPSQDNPETMPPLPPLPPMQWRIGKIQTTPLDEARDMIDHSRGMLERIQPHMVDQKVRFEFSSFDREIAHPSNPFLSFPVEEHQRSQQLTTELVDNSLLPTPPLSEMPTFGIDAHCQQDHFSTKRTDSVNSFLTSPEMPDESHGPDFLALGGKSDQSRLNSFSLEPGVEHAAAVIDTLITQVLPVHPFKLFASETALELRFSGQSSQNSEGEHGNSSGKSEILPTMEGQLHHHDFATSQGLTVWPPMTLATAPIYEVGKPNGNRISRPQNPLIDAVAAHDKSKLRKVAERVRPQVGPKVEERDSLLEQIRTKSFNLKPPTATRPSIQGPKTNLKVAAILEKAIAIRQALAGSDEDDDSDSWSDS